MDDIMNKIFLDNFKKSFHTHVMCGDFIGASLDILKSRPHKYLIKIGDKYFYEKDLNKKSYKVLKKDLDDLKLKYSKLKNEIEERKLDLKRYKDYPNEVSKRKNILHNLELNGYFMKQDIIDLGNYLEKRRFKEYSSQFPKNK